MTDKPIIFSAPMVRALLDGRKTQTRRVLGKTGKGRGRSNIFNAGIAWSDSYVLDPGNASWRADCTPCAPGDRLWVKEAWWAEAHYDDLPPREIPKTARLSYQTASQPVVSNRYRHARFMPRWASRLTLTVTDVRVQRLQEISAPDVLAEGVSPVHMQPGGPYGNPSESWLDFREGFRTLWNSLHGPDAWDANPWVAAVSFTVQRGNIDA